MKYIKGDLIKLAKRGFFDVIGHGCNCFCTMGSGIAPKMAKEFDCNKFRLEENQYKADINKLGCIDYQVVVITIGEDEFSLEESDLTVINCYTQYYYGKNHPDGKYLPVDYDAIRLCMRKINNKFKGKKIGLPKIGCGLAGGDWNIVSKIISEELINMDVTIVEYDGN